MAVQREILMHVEHDGRSTTTVQVPLRIEHDPALYTGY
jgi:hypothetical protein